MYSLESLQSLKGAQLKDICTNYKIKKSGNKPDLIKRIMEHEKSIETLHISNSIINSISNDVEKNENIEVKRIIDKFNGWLFKSEFNISKENGFHLVPLTISEIQNEFNNYETSLDVPSEKFLNLFFEKIDSEWYLINNDTNEPVDIEEIQQDLQKYMMNP